MGAYMRGICKCCIEKGLLGRGWGRWDLFLRLHIKSLSTRPVLS